jgi:F-type H+-transporting ATPase subunit delta
VIDKAKDNATEVTADSGERQVAAIYAKALLGVTEKAGTSAAAIAEIDTLVEVLNQHPKLEQIFASGLVGEDEKQGIVNRVFAPKVSKAVADFLNVLARRDRLGSLRAIHLELHRQHDNVRGVVPVQVTTASELSPIVAERLKQSLRKLVDGEPRLDTQVDPDLIGGAVVRVGDTVYDGSVARQLEHLRLQMINRSVHEIQSRRDRFRHPGGN